MNACANAPPRDRSVFINCPFDPGYESYLDALMFAVLCSRCEPRSAVEEEAHTDLRLDRIVTALADSRLSIHDLSRSKGEGRQKLARFNMPFELGMAMALKLIRRQGAGGETAPHDCVVLAEAATDPRRKVDYGRVISDIKGLEIVTYAGHGELMTATMGWLRGRLYKMGASPLPKLLPLHAHRGWPAFCDALAVLRQKWPGGKPLWIDRVEEGRKVVRRLEREQAPAAATAGSTAGAPG